jgi:hypothetical protein
MQIGVKPVSIALGSGLGASFSGRHSLSTVVLKGEHLIGDLLSSSLRLKTGRIAQGNLLPMSGQRRRIGLVEGECSG